MTVIRKFILLAGIMSMLAGCSALNSLTGGTDDTVLPGAREDAIPGRTSFPDNSGVPTASSADQAAPADPSQSESQMPTKTACKKGDPGCTMPKGNDTFKDPQ